MNRLKNAWLALTGKLQPVAKPMARDLPYGIGSRHLPGLSKLLEENGEVDQVIGKIIGLGHMGMHWDGTNLKERLEDELADQRAADAFVTTMLGLDWQRMMERADKKIATFHMWHERVLAGLDPVTGEPEA